MIEELSCKGLRVLVAEDTPVSRKLMRAWLRALGCETDFAVNGKEAVEKVDERDYDIVLMDIMMPVMDGLDATKAIRRSGHPVLPLLALTAAVTREDRGKSRAAGLDDFLSKPIDTKQLKEKLIKWGGASRGSPSPEENGRCS